ncbi:MAG: xylulokinase, partial [Anaerolinea sp.]|nr:xylulokinase [Anaerolinea sp.]
PALLDAARAVILPKDYVRLKLTGNVATDISDAAATGVFDVLTKTWSPEIIREIDLPRTLFPNALESTAVAGTLTASAAAALGLPAGIPVAAGCADQPAQALANGLIAPGKASVTIGSGGQVFTAVLPTQNGQLALKTDPRLHVFNHAVPGMWYILGAILAAGLSLRWLRNLFGTDYPTLSAEAAAVPVGANGLIFLPYLSGERTPHMDAHARGVFVGLTHYHGRGHMARAIMEGVAFALRDALDISLSLGGQVEQIIAAGGGSTSAVWRGICADVFGVPLQPTLLTESTGIGAALLGGIGTGVYPSIQAAAATARYGDLTEPDAVRQTQYAELYQLYQSLYPQLRGTFHRLAALTLKHSA